MAEISKQTKLAIDGGLTVPRVAKAREEASRLHALCAAEAKAAVRQEVQSWEASLQRSAVPSSPATPSAPAAAVTPQAFEAFRSGFASRLRFAAAPLHRELDTLAASSSGTGALGEAGAALRRCQPLATQVEACNNNNLLQQQQRSAGSGAPPPPTEVSEPDRLFGLVAEGDIREALRCALLWDVKHPAARGQPSLLERVCDRWRGGGEQPAGSVQARPDELLQREEVGAQLATRLRMVTIAQLLQGAVREGAPFERLDVNLEWVAALLQTIDAADDCLGELLTAKRAEMNAALEALQLGDGLAALVSAPLGERQRIKRTARMGSKSLGMLVRRWT